MANAAITIITPIILDYAIQISRSRFYNESIQIVKILLLLYYYTKYEFLIRITTARVHFRKLKIYEKLAIP